MERDLSNTQASWSSIVKALTQVGHLQFNFYPAEAPTSLFRKNGLGCTGAGLMNLFCDVWCRSTSAADMLGLPCNCLPRLSKTAKNEASMELKWILTNLAQGEGCLRQNLRTTFYAKCVVLIQKKSASTSQLTLV